MPIKKIMLNIIQMEEHTEIESVFTSARGTETRPWDLKGFFFF